MRPRKLRLLRKLTMTARLCHWRRFQVLSLLISLLRQGTICARILRLLRQRLADRSLVDWNTVYLRWLLRLWDLRHLKSWLA